MMWHHLRVARAWSAAGLLSCSFLSASALAEPSEPVPGAEADSQTVGILDAQASGTLDVKVRGQGADRVKVALRNVSDRRLKVVLPPGLVAAGATGQEAFQSMGLGPMASAEGGFGRSRGAVVEGAFRSIPANPPGIPADAESVAVSAGQSVEFTLPAVCLNFGKPTPTPRDVFRLMDADTYSTDPRIGKALRSLATLGTSHGVAQAAMWRICNDVPFSRMVGQFGKIVNRYEAALAARFVEALAASGSSEVVEPAHFEEGRLIVRVRAEGNLAAEADRLGTELDGLRVLGLPVRVVAGDEAPDATAPALFLTVTLASGRASETLGQIAGMHSNGSGWMPLGRASFAEGSSAAQMDGQALAHALDRAVASAFVEVRPVVRSVGNTTLKVENHLPFSLGAVVLRAGHSAGSPSVRLDGLGIGPARTGLTPIQAAGATIESIEVNGL